MPLTRRLLALFVMAGIALPVCALDPSKQVTQYVHDVWTTNDGLPQDSVNSVVQTPDGYLWLATQEGLARFDGASFTTFDSQTTRGLMENFVHTSFVDRRGRLWIGASGGMLRYEGNGRFASAWDAAHEPTTSARQVTEGPDGSLWIGMGSDGTSGAKGLLHFDGRILKIYTTNDGLSSNVVSYTAFDRSGDLWIATSNGLDVLNGGRITRRYRKSDGLAHDVVRCVLVDRAGDVWAGTEGGLTVIRRGRVTSYTTHDGLADNRVHRVLEDRDGTIWIATPRGLSRFVNGHLERAMVPGLAEQRIFALFEDREGSLWIGTGANGLHRLRSAKFTAIGAQEGLLGDNVNGLFEDRANRLWIGVSPGGVDVLAPRALAASSANPMKALTDAPLAGGGRSFFQDVDGSMWIGTRDGLNHLADGKLTSWTTADGLPDSSVTAIARDRRGVLWIGTGRGLARFENGRPVAVVVPPKFPPSTRILFEDRRGRVWFGGGEGLAWWDGNSFHVDPQFASSHLVSVAEDDDGTLWFGTWSQGLHRYRNGKLTKFTTRDGLYDDVAWALLDDRRGNLWMGSNRGIYRVAKKDLEDFSAGRANTIRCANYGVPDGLRKRETNWGSPAAVRTSDGRLWFGTTGGAVVIDPATVQANRIAPPVVVERFVADEREYPLDRALVLPAGSHYLEIHYAGLSLVSPERVRYRYRLEGYDEHWIDAGSRRTAYYTNVDPGAYRFQVIAANDDGVWNRVGATIAFELEPFFHQTPWFYALVVAALILLGVLINAIRERHRRVRHQAFHDSLTGLPNRILLDERSTAALADAQKSARSIAIMFLDLDGFKQVNDTFGHAAGDELLKIVATRFRACLRQADTLARIGGDEFAVLVDATDPRSTATEIAHRILDAVQSPLSLRGEPVRLGVSIGIAVHPDDGGDTRSMLQAADRAMYRAKLGGGNAFEFPSPV